MLKVAPYNCSNSGKYCIQFDSQLLLIDQQRVYILILFNLSQLLQLSDRIQ